MPPATKRRLTFTSVTVDLGCGSCKRPRLSSFFNPVSTKRSHSKPSGRGCGSYSSSSSTSTSTSSSSCSKPAVINQSEFSATPSCGPTESPLSGYGKLGSASVAVEKDSNDPYIDFRDSMLQMIFEKQIFSGEDLRELLNCFLELNAPYYHGVIVRAFADIWNGVFLAASSSLSTH